jgi:hypothetical protein
MVRKKRGTRISTIRMNIMRPALVPRCLTNRTIKSYTGRMAMYMITEYKKGQKKYRNTKKSAPMMDPKKIKKRMRNVLLCCNSKYESFLTIHSIASTGTVLSGDMPYKIRRARLIIPQSRGACPSAGGLGIIQIGLSISSDDSSRSLNRRMNLHHFVR